MTTVNPTSAASTAASVAQAAGKSVSKLGINDFITLMTTQMKYQDPTKPQDSAAFVAQLAQFSSVSGIQEMNTSIASLLDQMRSSQALSATALVGHNVLVDADSATLGAGEGMSGEIDTPTGTSNINMTVTDAAGQVVRQISVPATTGASTFNWDGLDDSGKAAPAGTYKFNAIANVYGKSISVVSSLHTRIGSITIDPTDNSLVLNTSSLGPISMTKVRQVI